ncbi:MAG: FAD:protein FMN transferase [Gammaproteobacteria bacterium]|nr:MAG: FAD:protein FMN transferase [Gammaproteobacteria bacterium]
MTLRNYIYGIWLGLVLSFSVAADWYREEAPVMGTLITVELWHEDAERGKALAAAVLDEMHRIDRLMSTYKPDSELSRVNDQAAREPVIVSRELLGLVMRALSFSEVTGGAFDITYASAGKYYNYRESVRPTTAQLEQALPAIDYRHVKLDTVNSTIAFDHPGVRIDLGGIAKGYAVDRSIEILRKAGVLNALVSAGGDTRVIGERWGRAWKVGIRDPRNRDGVVTMIPLMDLAISTSGDYERFFEEDGVRYHHILNPSTGQSTSAVHSASIIGSNATTTDALSTSIFVMGVTNGLQLINSLTDTEAVIIDNQGRMHYSAGLDQAH